MNTLQRMTDMGANKYRRREHCLRR